MSQAGEISLSRSSAAYVRMSDDHQLHSTDNQLLVIRRYAQEHGLEIMHVFSDEGRSGLTLQGRPALSQLISKVLAEDNDFSHLLVYDISRWGRFQDADEAAHYEFLCRKAGVIVHYCAEEFPNDGSLTSVVAKGFKRAMAGEYSRELSVKVFRAASRAAKRGYFVGGRSVMGLRRLLVDQNRQPKTLLNPGERKHLQSDRVVLVPGPDAEIQVVRWIFQSFVEDRLGPTEIARRLNRQGNLSPSGRRWTDIKIGHTLRNERYIGNLVYARRSGKLGTKSVPNPPDHWIRAENIFPAIVPKELFFKAQERFKINDLDYKYTEAELLEKLRALHAKHGHLTEYIVNDSTETPPANTYVNRFGSLVTAYKLIGFQTRRPYRLLHERFARIRREMIRAVIRKVQSFGGTANWVGRTRQLVINGEIRVRVYLISCDQSPAGTPYWRIHHKVQAQSDLTLAVRMDRDNQQIKDFYLLPHLEGRWEELQLMERNGIYVDAFRFQTLDFLAGLAARTKLRTAA
jgi:DNA invertase Pin-like site-specific DNA recombinase